MSSKSGLFLPLSSVITSYNENTNLSLKTIDAFLGFLVVVGGLQFGYALLVGTYPFNSFLSGFISCVGQFVITVGFRMALTQQELQSSSSKKKSPVVSPYKRAFLEFCFSSLVLHFFAVNFLG
ncbi:putative dolichyl-diphosphooligosaccharide--protein glycosyltransferase subunit ost2 [Schizosaccharomyces pombe]|uniref:Probable dolichyl-diphosphooligosaccharide--protein glycosyltransferase subunit ost2 n=1 Tax=Schizosaccharomyces pombe (strain 972 / ATCC 24843) TaxID=284812 RepID=OST2_SCHPO|nr:putative oligosaccharyltransferase epsilon subunit Ost2 [Schizosaccharomyces pombe]O14238.1 RecName: Full=Probable dolichyl-diphosphooligosaccharide--protein glycosyltransferase subunit ost2; AltName: Full=Oligosaccharyl transferase 16 kDa subunit; AltName: Full=Oligosaccharyl transferase subunit epsilon [Schizosaccharomyces pombe 972h-]CAB11729.1 oligosaccharyltransferase epsilon subunit Ost2 (predicted) [Schizosaccharomyces pombe]|eukprot:NP_593898.1 putative oligosaccharyltransferase epsilon subunit Ost2 [Schizosaccharomyces pombe]